METIVSHIYHSPIGQLNITADDGCITELGFIDEQNTPAFIDHDAQLPDVIHQCVDELIEYFAGTRREFTVPINQEGTEFQQKVWKELYELPFGKTLSYADLAKKLGDPKVIRAAAAANGKNKITVFFLPKLPLKVTSTRPSEVFVFRVKSGAFEPMEIGICREF